MSVRQNYTANAGACASRISIAAAPTDKLVLFEAERLQYPEQPVSKKGRYRNRHDPRPDNPLRNR
jgi:hypothetical protein